MVIEEAIDVLRIEAEGITGLIDRIDARFEQMVDLICAASGRLIVAGIGKSGIIARKLVATLNSTGTRALFLHPVEAMHGDLGMVGPDDIFLAISNSGETDELNILVPSIRSIGCKIIAFTGKKDSTLARNSDVVIDVSVPREACPLGLAPTASTAAQLAMGDALAVVLINKKHFKSDDFRKNHPGGNLGHRLIQKVTGIMLTGHAVPRVGVDASMEAALAEIERLQMGVTLVVDAGGRLAGIITDGDIRRAVAQDVPIRSQPATALMTAGPKALGPDELAYDALNLMESHQITVLPIVSPSGGVLGILHLHDILGKGEFRFNGS